MKFSKLLDTLESGQSQYYMTTQTVLESDEGPLSLGGDILLTTPLVEEFPKIPFILK